MRWNLSSSYLALPDLFYTVQPAQPVTRPSLTVFNRPLARELGLGEWDEGDLTVLSGNASLPGSPSFAQAYAGHQFGGFTLLGDGRALVLGEHRDPSGRVFDLQLKGSGRTPYSRSGDGRAALGPMLREYVIGEAMAGLGIATTRALAVVETGDTVWRDGPSAGAVLTRVAESHLRVGTFEFAAAAGDFEALHALVGYAIARHYPEAAAAPNPAAAFLEAVVAAQARLVARWMAAGFVHGVMNTDNMAVSGQTIDYGPCAFLDAYRPGQVFSSIDRQGRYAYANQPGIARWNLTRLAEALLPVIADDETAAVAAAQPLIDAFGALYEAEYFALMAAKLGLGEVRDGDRDLVTALLAVLESSGADYASTFRRLTDGDAPGLGPWTTRWQDRLRREPDPTEVRQRMEASNPVYYPRNHLVQAALDSATAGDLQPLETLVALVRDPFTRRAGFEAYEAVPEAGSSEPYVTYCGT